MSDSSRMFDQDGRQIIFDAKKEGKQHPHMLERIRKAAAEHDDKGTPYKDRSLTITPVQASKAMHELADIEDDPHEANKMRWLADNGEQVYYFGQEGMRLYGCRIFVKRRDEEQ